MLTVLLNTVNEEVIFEYWCKLNEYIARNEALEWGKLRTGTVGISGTDYVPPVPEKEKTIEELKNILSSTSLSVTDKAVYMFLHIITQRCMALIRQGLYQYHCLHECSGQLA